MLIVRARRNLLNKGWETAMKTRRAILKSATVVVSGAALGVLTRDAQALDDVCKLRAAQLEEAMEDRHGGKWSVRFDKKNRFVLILR